MFDEDDKGERAPLLGNQYSVSGINKTTSSAVLPLFSACVYPTEICVQNLSVHVKIEENQPITKLKNRLLCKTLPLKPILQNVSCVIPPGQRNLFEINWECEDCVLVNEKSNLVAYVLVVCSFFPVFSFTFFIPVTWYLIIIFLLMFSLKGRSVLLSEVLDQERPLSLMLSLVAFLRLLLKAMSSWMEPDAHESTCERG